MLPAVDSSLHADSPRPTQTVDLGGFLRGDPLALLARSGLADLRRRDDCGRSTPEEFYIASHGLIVSFSRDPDVDHRLAEIARIEEVSKMNEAWITTRRLNGDQSNRGRPLSMAANQVHIERVVLSVIERIRDAVH